LLKPGGWLFDAGKKPRQYEIPQADWAIQHGYAHAEHHVWLYERRLTEQEAIATQIEMERLISVWPELPQDELDRQAGLKNRQDPDGSVPMWTYENVLIAQKPARQR
jgi:hypothetical protein